MNVVVGIERVLHNEIPQVLCGVGGLDSTEIAEAVSVAVHCSENNLLPRFYAPDIEIGGLVNHLTKQPDDRGGSRNALIESARLARPTIQSLCECTSDSAEALIIPGGYGAARTLLVYNNSHEITTWRIIIQLIAFVSLAPKKWLRLEGSWLHCLARTPENHGGIQLREKTHRYTLHCLVVGCKSLQRGQSNSRARRSDSFYSRDKYTMPIKKNHVQWKYDVSKKSLGFYKQKHWVTCKLCLLNFILPIIFIAIILQSICFFIPIHRKIEYLLKRQSK